MKKNFTSVEETLEYMQIRIPEIELESKKYSKELKLLSSTFSHHQLDDDGLSVPKPSSLSAKTYSNG